MIRRFMAIFCLTMCFGQSADANYISSVTVLSNISDTSTLPATENAFYNDALTTTNTGGAFTALTTQIDLYVTAFALQAPFALQFARVNNGTDSASHTYTVALHVLNDLGGKSPIDPSTNLPNTRPVVDPGDTGKEIGPFSAAITSGSGAILNPATTSASPFAFALNDQGLNSNSQILFGGRSGGGGAIPFGQTEIFTFNVTTAALNGQTFGMTFTANPEPGSLALAGLIGIPGLIAARRRRKNVAKSPAPVA